MLSISITLTSGIVGFGIAEKLNKKGVFFNFIKSFILTKNINFYTLIGLKPFTWIVKNTFFKHLNQKIKITNHLNIEKAKYLLDEITISEICHLIGFIIVIIVQIIILLFFGFNNLFVFLLILNISLNLYPFFLQERNKLRITKLISIYNKKYDF